MKRLLPLFSLAPLLALLLVPPASAVTAKRIDIESFHADILVFRDGAIEVTETIRPRFTGQWNGLFRTIPVEYRSSSGFNYTLRIKMESITDGNGDWIYTFTLYGPVGKISNIKATIGAASEQTATGTYEITGELEQAFNAITDILSDTRGHAEFIRMHLSFILNVSSGSVVIEGPEPWVTVIGEINDDGNFMATGRGTVAGFPDIAVVFGGTISMDRIAGEYTMGAEGGLPAGESITYLVIGEAENSAGVLASDFFDLFNAAQGAGDSARMLEMLHPAVLELYGAEACSGYLASIVNPAVTIEVLSAVEIGVWEWIRDGQTLPIADTSSVQVNIHNGDAVSQSQLHLAVRPDGTLGWFTDCGESQA